MRIGNNIYGIANLPFIIRYKVKRR